MSLDTLLALITFAFVASITPGPNNLMLMASGANFGLKRTLPHMFGVGLGFTFMLLVVGAGLTSVFTRFQFVDTAMKLASVLFLCYLAWKIATAAPVESKAEKGTPFTFLQAALFQWVNPKAWAMALSAMSLYSPDQRLFQVVLVALTFGLVNIPCVSTWVIAGQKLQQLLNNPYRLRAFNIVMALLLIASMYPVLRALQT